VRLLPDGATVRSAENPPLPPRPRRTLVLGGARSGKSAHAERLLSDQTLVTYIATAETRINDKEWQQRIAAHRDRRPKHWTTRETSDLVATLSNATSDDVFLIDCLTLWLTRALDETDAWGGNVTLVDKRIDELVTAWSETAGRVVAVSNEVGWGIVPQTASGRLFRDVQGRLNARIAAVSDEVTLVVAGQTMSIGP
jgi:adenosylcobinamide kinase/adenosylcobinamide-phosphate guanylyltransferase